MEHVFYKSDQEVEINQVQNNLEVDNWLKAPGDLDDFIFYGSLDKVHSEK